MIELRPKARWFQRQLTVLRVHAADCLATGSTLILNLQGSLVQSVEFLLTWASWTSAPGAENNFEGCLDARQMVKAWGWNNEWISFFDVRSHFHTQSAPCLLRGLFGTIVYTSLNVPARCELTWNSERTSMLLAGLKLGTYKHVVSVCVPVCFVSWLETGAISMLLDGLKLSAYQYVHRWLKLWSHQYVDSWFETLNVPVCS